MKILLTLIAAIGIAVSSQASVAKEMELSPTDDALMTAYTYERCVGTSLTMGQWSAILSDIADRTGEVPSLSNLVRIKRSVTSKASGNYCVSSDAKARVEKFQMGTNA